MSESSPRQQRSMLGFLGALMVLLIAVGAFVGFRSLFRDNREVRPDPVDYLAAVDAIHRSNRVIAYPTVLPKGWVATSVTLPPLDDDATDGSWGLGVVTDRGRFVGLRQETREPEDLVHSRLGSASSIGDEVVVTNPQLPGWREVVPDPDRSRDAGIVARWGQQSLLVYGSVDQRTLIRFAESLSTSSP